MTIYRTVFQVVVYSDGPFDTARHSNPFDPFDLEAINYAITEGDCIGDTKQVSSEAIPPNLVQRHLLDIGNDGTFFDPVDDQVIPQTEEEARVCVHGNAVWFGNECGECDGNGFYAWEDT